MCGTLGARLVCCRRIAKAGFVRHRGRPGGEREVDNAPSKRSHSPSGTGRDADVADSVRRLRNGG